MIDIKLLSDLQWNADVALAHLTEASNTASATNIISGLAGVVSVDPHISAVLHAQHELLQRLTHEVVFLTLELERRLHTG